MSADDTPNQAAAAHPIDAAVLADYWLAALSDAEETSVEEHLLDCDECGARLREMIALAEGIRHLARDGVLRMIVSDVFLERCRAGGQRVREYAARPGESVQCTVTDADDFLIARLSADLAGAARVDLCLCDPQGVEQIRLSDIPVPASAGSVIYQESITFVKDLPTTTLVARLMEVGEAGHERLLGEYTFNHTRSLPGPGAA